MNHKQTNKPSDHLTIKHKYLHHLTIKHKYLHKSHKASPTCIPQTNARSHRGSSYTKLDKPHLNRHQQHAGLITPDRKQLCAGSLRSVPAAPLLIAGSYMQYL